MPHTARVTSIRALTPRVVELEATMVEPDRLDYRAGQYVSIYLPGTSDQRSYSIASSPGDPTRFALLVRRQGGAGSAFLSSLETDDTFQFDGPRGAFQLADEHPGDVVFAATGVGVAPLFPMAEALLARGGDTQVRLYWGLMDETDVFWPERVAALAANPRFASTLVLTGLGQGFVTEPVIATASELGAPTYYLCGNGQMIRDVIDGLVTRGVDLARIRTDWT